MDIEKQVVSLELSKKLKELGVKQESLFYWANHIEDLSDGDSEMQVVYNDIDTNRFYREPKYSAFTVAELGKILKDFNECVCSYYNYVWKCDYVGDRDTKFLQNAKTEADVRAKMVIYLLENNLIK